MNIDNWALVGVLVVLFRKLVKKKAKFVRKLNHRSGCSIYKHLATISFKCFFLIYLNIVLCLNPFT